MRLGELPVGALVKEQQSGTLFYVAAQNHPGYQGTTLITRHIIAARAFDAREPSNPEKTTFRNPGKYGNNEYALSNIHQWLNSEEEDWYHPSHPYDAPPDEAGTWYGEQPYHRKPGFLARFSPEFRAGILEVQVPYTVRTGVDSSECRTVQAKAFLPSRTEINFGDEWGIPEGVPFPLFEQDPYLTYAVPSPDQVERHGRDWNPPSEYAGYDDPGIFHPKLGWKYWLRSACSKYSFVARYFHPVFQLSYDKVCIDVTGVRPVLNLDPEMSCCEEQTEQGTVWRV